MVREPRRVLVLTEDAAKVGHGKADYFVKALKANDFSVDVRTPQELPNIEIQPYQAIYLFEVPSPDARVWGFLLGFVQQGIGLGIVPGGDEINRDAYNQGAALKVMPGQLGEKMQVGKDGKTPGAVWNLEDDNVYQHPLMRPMRAWKDYGLVTRSSESFFFWNVKAQPERTWEVVRYKDDKKLPALIEGVLAVDKGKPGKILLFTTPLDARTPRWNNFLETRNWMYVGLVRLATNYLAGSAEAVKYNFVAGREEPVVQLPRLARFSSYRLVGPDVLKEITPADRQSELRLPELEAQARIRCSAWPRTRRIRLWPHSASTSLPRKAI